MGARVQAYSFDGGHGGGVFGHGYLFKKRLCEKWGFWIVDVFNVPFGALYIFASARMARGVLTRWAHLTRPLHISQLGAMQSLHVHCLNWVHVALTNHCIEVLGFTT